MTPEQIQALCPALTDFLHPYLFCCGYTQTFDLLQVYCRGLLSDLKRKSCEPIALAAGVAVRTLQEFLRDHLWPTLFIASIAKNRSRHICYSMSRY